MDGTASAPTCGGSPDEGFFRWQLVLIDWCQDLILVHLVGFALPRVINEVFAVLGIVVAVPSFFPNICPPPERSGVARGSAFGGGVGCSTWVVVVVGVAVLPLPKARQGGESAPDAGDSAAESEVSFYDPTSGPDPLSTTT